jgi:four helix bundle protein
VLLFPFQATSPKGQAHYTNREFIRFLRHARGSLAEIETQVLIAQDRKYFQAGQADQLTHQSDELGRVLSGLINSLKKLEEEPN